jgi:hypothetical protein
MSEALPLPLHLCLLMGRDSLVWHAQKQMEKELELAASQEELSYRKSVT